jgi:hypothetical protein
MMCHFHQRDVEALTRTNKNSVFLPTEKINTVTTSYHLSLYTSHLRRKILIAYDNSEFSQKMFEWSLGQILRSDNDHVVLATVLDVQESTYFHRNWGAETNAGRKTTLVEYTIVVLLHFALISLTPLSRFSRIRTSTVHF